MKTCRFIKKIFALGTSLLLSTTAILADTKQITLSDYPYPFISQGQFDGKIVVGKNAAASDVIGAVDIAASLQGQAIEEIPIPLPPDIPQGDAYELTTKSNLFEFREGIRDVLVGGTLGNDQLDSLKSGTINSDQGNTQYNQYLRFGSGANGDSLSNWTLYFGPNDDPNEKVGDHLLVPELQLTGAFSNLSQNALFEYELEFQDGLRSSIKSKRSKLVLKSVEQKVFNIFGTDFSLVDTTVQGSTNATDVTLNFMGGDVVDQIEQGDTKVYTIDGVDYEITALFIADPRGGDAPSIKFSINGELTQQLQPGDVDVLSQGIQIGVQDVLVSGTGGLVTFFLGVNKLSFKDTNIQDANFSQNVRAGSERIDGGWVRILGDMLDNQGANAAVQAGQSLRIDYIQYRFLSKAIRGTTNIYVPPGHGIREFLDKPQGMLNPNWDIKYTGLYPAKSQPIRISPAGDNEYRLTFTNSQNLQYSVPLAEVSETTGFRFGRGDTQKLVFVEPFDFTTNYTASGDHLEISVFPVNRKDYFLITNQRATGFDPNGITRAFSYESIDTGNKRITFNDLSEGSITLSYSESGNTDSFVLGTGSVIVSGVPHNFYIANFSNSTIQYPLAIDVDGDSIIGGDKAQITTYGRGVIDLTGIDFTLHNWVNRSNITAGNGIVVNVTVDSSILNSGGLRGGEYLHVNLTTKAGLNEIDMQSITYFRNGVNYNTLASGDFRRFKLYRGTDQKEHSTAATDFGAIVDQYTPGNDVAARELIIDFPEYQRGGQVLITGGQKKKTLQANSLSTKKVNPIPVGFSVLDTDAPRVGTENMIVVGGPCANRISAELLNKPQPCGKGFEKEKAFIKLIETGDKWALLIAGYDSLETLGASYVIADAQKYGLVGSEMEILVKDLDRIIVTPIR
ncbi:MAG TPA: hypothetical protein VJG90_02460 [Candidatus Nanoarchaeia archaeon]|nr:hypothetical protein [Candidatus Nanoarchaeia archaeon]